MNLNKDAGLFGINPVNAPNGKKKQLRIGFILSAVFVLAIIALVLVLK